MIQSEEFAMKETILDFKSMNRSLNNVTTFIAAGVLYALGSGTIKGFAITLGLGVVLTFITAVFLTRLLLNLCCDMYITSTGLYGVKERSVQ